jgi:hypothetical protein
MKDQLITKLIKEALKKRLNESDSMSTIWKDADIVRKTKILYNKNIADAREMALKYKNEPWEKVKKELDLK